MYKNFYVCVPGEPWELVTNSSPRGAACQFARERDLDMPDDPIFYQDEGLVVMVRDGEGDVVKFRVYGELEPTYCAIVVVD